jgi:hypothetical protein
MTEGWGWDDFWLKEPGFGGDTSRPQVLRLRCAALRMTIFERGGEEGGSRGARMPTSQNRDMGHPG